MNLKEGAKWIRADFHLHTKADEKWFKYKGEANDFVNDYIQKLEEENIRFGVITNHNKFDKDEYMAIHKKAAKAGIYLLSGVEIPTEVFEELLVNALIHRDYFINSLVKVFIFPNRIEIISPGKLPNSLTVENILNGISIPPKLDNAIYCSVCFTILRTWNWVNTNKPALQ